MDEVEPIGDDLMQSQCPACKEWQDDYDGFGVLACPCGYCSHPSITDGICGLCERRIENRGDLPQSGAPK